MLIQRRSDLLLCHDISLEERIKIADEYIEDLNESLSRVSEAAQPRLHEQYRQHIRSLEVTRQKLIDALFEQTIWGNINVSEK